MKPVAIFRHSAIEGPGYFAIFLEQQGIPWRLIAVDQNETIPHSADQFSGLCFMGGPMSVNDPFPWIDQVTTLIRQAAEQNIPVIGHCLGGQLISKALGGKITANPIKEIGWGHITPTTNEATKHWLGDFANHSVSVFHWHGETFSLPKGASHLMTNAHCTHQMFALGPHLAMQCHVEMTPELVTQWSKHWDEETHSVINRIAIQTPEQMLQEIEQHLPVMRQLADQLYSTWTQGLSRC